MLDLSHKNLKAWTDSITLVTQIYILTSSFPKEELYGLTSQMKRSAVSIASNIAEGSSRDSKTEQHRFFEIARSSLVELDTQIEIAITLEFVSHKDLEQITKNIQLVFALISGLIKKIANAITNHLSSSFSLLSLFKEPTNDQNR